MSNWKNRIVGHGVKPADQFTAHPDNPRRHPEAQRRAVRGSLDTLGFIAPVVENVGTGYLIDGHERVMQALAGNQPVPFIQVDLTEEEERQALATFDFITYMAQYEEETIRQLMSDIDTDNEDISRLLEDMDVMLDDMLTEDAGIGLVSDGEDPGPQVDRVEQLQKKWQVATGDVYEAVGVSGLVHRIMCGDSTNAEDVARLMDGARAAILFTSPPYADIREYGGNDLSAETLIEFIPIWAAFSDYLCVNLGIKRRDFEIVSYWDDYIDKARDSGLKLLSWNVWDKLESGSIGQQSAMFPVEHEWVFVFGEQPKEPNRIIKKSEVSADREKYYRKDSHGRKVTNRRQADGSMRYSTNGVIYTHKPMGSVLRSYPEKSNVRELHPAIMRVDVAENYILAITDKNNVISEPFTGSGTTLVACEQTGRRGYGMEIHPPYVAVTLERLNGMGLDVRKIAGVHT